MDMQVDYGELFKNHSDIGICVFDSHGRFLYTNNAFLKIRNVTKEEYLGLTPHDLYNKNLTDKCILDSVYKTRTITTDVQTVMSKDGTILRKHLVTIQPILNEAGEITSAVAYYKDLQLFTQEYDDSSARVHTTDSVNFFREWLDGSRTKPPFVAESENMKELCRSAHKVSNIGSTVLITGETGTGKEVFASYIHSVSSRRDHDFIVVDCTSLPESLMESELFGYEKGTFTGALTHGKKGLIESADGGTLFLDEINSLPISLQGKLLRVIETKTIKKLGSVQPKPVDFRLVAATNVDLQQCIKDKTFRADLFYRLNVLPFHMPSLRDRKNDIIPLTNYFLDKFYQQYGICRELSPKVYAEMLEYSWPGNVRELRNFVERMVIMGVEANTGLYGGAEYDAQLSTKPEKLPLNGIFEGEEERKIILSALDENQNHRERTAKYLHISRRTLQYKLKKYNIG